MYSSHGISGMFHLHEVGYDSHVPVLGFCDTLPVCLQSRVCGKSTVMQCTGLSVCTSEITVSRDSHGVISKFTASIVVALIPMCGEHWLA